MPFCDGYTEQGLYGFFCWDDDDDSWAIALFPRHVLLFGKPPPKAIADNADEMKGREIKEYPDAERQTLDKAYAEIFPAYADIDHGEVMLKNTERLQREAQKIIKSGEN